MTLSILPIFPPRGPCTVGNTQVKTGGCPCSISVRSRKRLLAQVKCFLSPHIITQSGQPCLAALTGCTNSAPKFSPITHTLDTASTRHPPQYLILQCTGEVTMSTWGWGQDQASKSSRQVREATLGDTQSTTGTGHTHQHGYVSVSGYVCMLF